MMNRIIERAIRAIKAKTKWLREVNILNHVPFEKHIRRYYSAVKELVERLWNMTNNTIDLSIRDIKAKIQRVKEFNIPACDILKKKIISSNELLTDLIKEKRKVSFYRKIVSYLNNLFKFEEFYIPSVGSFFRIFIIFVVTYCIGFLIFEETVDKGNLLAIHSGIGVVVFALVIFVAESMREADYTDRARVILKESYLFPLVVAEILTFFIFLLSVNLWSVVFVCGIGGLAIWSTSRIMFLLLSRYEFAKKRAELFISWIRINMDQFIDEKIGNDILVSRLNDQDIKWQHTSPIDHKSKYHIFNPLERGIISDIRLGKLKKISDIIVSESNKNSSPSSTEELGMIAMTHDSGCHIMVGFRSFVNENDSLIYVHKRVLGDINKVNKIRDLVYSAFVIDTKDTLEVEFRSTISGMKEQMISAIVNEQIGKIEELINLYAFLTNEFLELTTEFGDRFYAEQSHTERRALFYGWAPIQWLFSDIRYIFEKAVKCHDSEIIKKVSYLPIRVVYSAIKKNDQLFFQRFIGFSELFYRYSRKEADGDLKAFLFDRSWRHLSDISRYVVSDLGRRTSSQEELEIFKDFCVHFLFMFQNLMKVSFEEGDSEGFKVFSKETKKILKLQSELDDIKKEIRTRKNQMYFGIASCILDHALKNNRGYVMECYNSVQGFFDSFRIEDFTKVFLDANTFEVVDFWRWDWWEELSEGDVHSINTSGKLERFYAIKSLSLIAQKNEAEIGNIDLPFDRDLSNLVGGSGGLTAILNDIKETPHKWKFVLHENAIGKVEHFEQLLEKAKRKQNETELDSKRRMNISQDKVGRFKDEVLKQFKEHAAIRDIFTRYLGAYEDKMETRITKNPFGINNVTDKALFFDEWHVDFHGWGEDYVQSLVGGENSYLIRDITNYCAEINREDFDYKLSTFQNLDNVFILAVNIAFSIDFDESGKFKLKRDKGMEHLDVQGFDGWYDFNGKLIPVFEIYEQELSKRILILDKSRIGHLVQYSPLGDEEDEKFVKDIFCMDIRAFSEDDELMERIIGISPEWLQNIGDEQAQRRHLQTRVRIRIVEQFEYRKSEDFKGYKLLL